jgi:hypothetical protein
MHMDRNRARLRIGGWLDEIHMTMQNFIGQRLGSNLNILSLANLRELLLIDIRFDPPD